MAGLIGFALGNALQGAAGYAQAKAQKQQQHDALLLQTYQQHPEVAGTEEAQKFLKKKYGPEVADSFAQVGKISQQFGMDLSGKGSSAPAGGSAPQPAGGGTIAAGAPQGPQPHDMNWVNGEIQRLQGLQAKYKDPGQQKIIQDRLGFLQKQQEQLQQQGFQGQQKEEDRAQRQSIHEDTEADRQASRAMQEQFKADSEANRQQAQADRKTYQDATLALARERDTDKREQQIATLTKNLDSSRDKILADFGKTPTPAIKARVDGYNASASAFYQKHANSGAPTLLKYSEEPGTLQSWSAGKIGGPKPTVEAAPPTYVSYKGKSGWMDTDNNFYPDADK